MFDSAQYQVFNCELDIALFRRRLTEAATAILKRIACLVMKLKLSHSINHNILVVAESTLFRMLFTQLYERVGMNKSNTVLFTSAASVKPFVGVELTVIK